MLDCKLLSGLSDMLTSLSLIEAGPDDTLVSSGDELYGDPLVNSLTVNVKQ